MQRLRFAAPTAAPERCEAAAKRRQVEHLDPNRRGPEVAVVRAEEKLMRESRRVAAASRNRDEGRRIRLRGGGRPRWSLPRHDAHRREQEQHARRAAAEPDTAAPGHEASAQSSHRAKASAASPLAFTTIAPSRAVPLCRTSNRIKPLARRAKRVVLRESTW